MSIVSLRFLEGPDGLWLAIAIRQKDNRVDGDNGSTGCFLGI